MQVKPPTQCMQSDVVDRTAASKPQRCTVCHKQAHKMLKCDRCRVTYYCGVACQKIDLKHHKTAVCVCFERQKSDSTVLQHQVRQANHPVHPLDAGGALLQQRFFSLSLSLSLSLGKTCENSTVEIVAATFG